MSNKPQPRNKYNFGDMKQGDVIRVRIPDNDPNAGVRARCAAYAYGTRNGKQFCGAVDIIRKKRYMVIRRVDVPRLRGKRETNYKAGISQYRPR